MRENKDTTTRFRLDPGNPPTLTPEQAARLDAAEIDYSDLPELPDDFWEQHPPADKRPKRQITLRVDADILEYFCAGGPKYQTRINSVLRSFVEADKQRQRGRKYA